MMIKLCLFWISVLNGNFELTSVYRKPTFTDLFTNFESFLPTAHKKGFILSLFFRYFSICSSYQIFHAELEKFKKLLLQNGYPKFFMHRCVKRFLDKLFLHLLKFKRLRFPNNLFRLFYLIRGIMLFRSVNNYTNCFPRLILKYNYTCDF